MDLPKRKPNRLPNFDYNTPGAYFVTVCTVNREIMFWDGVGADIIRPECVPLSAVGKVVEKGIRNIPKHYEQITVDKYCIMPDHIHLILSIQSDGSGRILSAPTISTVVGSLKRWVSRQVGKPIWQKSFYDHGIRNHQDYLQIWEYIESNPARWKEDCFYQV